MNEIIAKYGLKYGPFALIAMYLIYFLVNTVHGQLDELVELNQHSAAIHNDMLTVLKDIRDERNVNTAMEYRSNAKGVR